jgi:hypothetical protein
MSVGPITNELNDCNVNTNISQQLPKDSLISVMNVIDIYLFFRHLASFRHC